MSCYYTCIKTLQLAVFFAVPCLASFIGFVTLHAVTTSYHLGFFPTLIFSFCMGFSPGLCRISTDLNQLLCICESRFAPGLYSVVELVFYQHSMLPYKLPYFDVLRVLDDALSHFDENFFVKVSNFFFHFNHILLLY